LIKNHPNPSLLKRGYKEKKMKKEFVTDKSKKEMIKTFIDLAKINSPTFKEGKISKHLVGLFKKAGCKVYVDGAGKKIPSESGNIIAHFKGTGNGKPIALSTHMDTVMPTPNIKITEKKDRIITDGKTILGGDAKSGITVILQVLKILKENKLKHPPIEVVITTSEEAGVFGSKNLDYKKLKAKYGLVLDNLFANHLFTKAPTRQSIKVKITGKAAHGGVEPEKGISAAEVFSKAVAKLKFGRLDSETTSNIGFVKGGQAINIVMPELEAEMEVRSHKPAKALAMVKKIKTVFEQTCKQNGKKVDGKMIYPKLEFKNKMEFPHMAISPGSPVVKQVKKSGRKYGLKVELKAGGGASDANNFYAAGIEVPNLGTGQRKAHTTDEYLDLKDFFLSARIALDVVLNLKY
jgi:tripeptide aminopeptidase